jgi:hypothetical protein
LSLRNEAFNLLKNPNFWNPASNLDAAPNFGVISSTVNNAGIVRFMLKLAFWKGLADQTACKPCVEVFLRPVGSIGGKGESIRQRVHPALVSR